MDYYQILTTLGLSAVISAIIQSYLTSASEAKKREYNERKEAYIGLVDSWKRQEQEGVTATNRLEVGHWILRCEFVGSPTVIKCLDDWVNSSPNEPNRIAATANLKKAMRDDMVSFK